MVDLKFSGCRRFTAKMSKFLGKFSQRRISLLSILMFLSAVHNPNLPSQKMKIRLQRDSNPQSSDSKSEALSVRPCVRRKDFEMCRFEMLKMPLFSCLDEQIFLKNYLRRSSLLSILMFLSAVHNPKLPSQKMKIRRQRDSNPQSLDSKSDALSVWPCVRPKDFEMCRFEMLKMPLFSCSDEQIFLKNYLRRSSLLSIMMFLSAVHNPKLPSQKMKSRPQRDSNPNLLIRSQTPYPLGHAAVGRIF